MVEEGRGKKIESSRVQTSQGLKVQGFQGTKDQDISKSYSNTSLPLKKVPLVLLLNVKHVCLQPCRNMSQTFNFTIFGTDPNLSYMYFGFMINTS